MQEIVILSKDQICTASFKLKDTEAKKLETFLLKTIKKTDETFYLRTYAYERNVQVTRTEFED